MKTFEKVQLILEEQLLLRIENILLSSELIYDLGADSLDIVEIILVIEEEFNIKISNIDISGIKTVGDLINYIDKNIKSK